jgi:hypothetical protein
MAMVSSLNTAALVQDQTTSVLLGMHHVPPLCRNITCIDSDNADAKVIEKWYEFELDEDQQVSTSGRPSSTYKS